MSREVYRCSDLHIEVFPSRDHDLFFAGAVSSKNWLVFAEALNYAPDVGDARVVSLSYGRSWSASSTGAMFIRVVCSSYVARVECGLGDGLGRYRRVNQGEANEA